MRYNGKFLATQKYISCQGKKALFGLLSNIKEYMLNTETKLQLFDTHIACILNYGCEIWGYHAAKDVEKVHLDFCKSILGVSKRTTTMMVYAELGRYPMKIIRTYRIIKYWLKLLKTKNCILKTCYDTLLHNINSRRYSWVHFVRDSLNSLGFSAFWDRQYVSNEKEFILNIRRRLYDQFIQECNQYLQQSPKAILYRYINPSHCLKFYLCKCIDFKWRNALSKPYV